MTSARHGNVSVSDTTDPQQPHEIPLSVGQSSLFFLQELAPESPAYHLAGCVTTDERLDADRLRRAWEAVWRRHPVLTGVIEAAPDGYVQRWYAAVPPFTVREVPGIAAPELLRLAAEDYEQPFALADEAPARFYLYQQGGTSTLHLVLHHIAGDLSSSFIVLEDLLTAYRAQDADGAADTEPLPAEPDTAYARHVAAERAFLDSGRSEVMRRYWADQLAGCAFALDLPGMTAPRPVADPDAPAYARFRLPADLAARVRAVSESSGTSSATVLLAALNVLLHKLTGGDDIVVGFPTEGRKKAFKRTVGYFTNSLLLRTAVAPGSSFDSVLAATHASLVGAVRHQALPAPTVLGRVAAGSALSGNSLYQVSFQFEPERLSYGTKAIFGGLGTIPLAGYDTEPVPVRQQVAQFPLRMQVGEVGDEIHGALHYDPARLDAATVAGYARLFEVLVAEATADPAALVEDLGVGGADVPAGWTGSGVPAAGDGRPVFVSVVERGVVAPSGVALVDGVGSWSFGELVRASGVLAAELRRRGVGAESVVGLCLPRGAAMVVGMLAVSRAGGAWLALDPGYPGGRLRLMAEDAGCGVVVCGGGVGSGVLGAVLPEGAVVLDLDGLDLAGSYDAEGLDLAEPGDLAYVVFTSGSTGRPKGVAITHAQLASSTAARVTFYGPDVPRFLLLSSFSFDSSYAGVFWTLTLGGTLVVPDAEQSKDADQLAALVERHRLTHTLTVPSFHRALLTRPGGPGGSLRTVVVAGEACPPDLVREHHAVLPGCALVNEYGPSEAAVWATAHVLHDDASGPVPIGRPIAGTTVHVLDGGLRGVAVGVVGELFVGGAGVGRGY
ncbi:AMP-binding protein, partial [Streptomyces sp. NPDC091201]|uniref:AMP-binding protein n=2 Tax=Streptomyces TaxID=1883 RepID=UPI00341EBD1D